MLRYQKSQALRSNPRKLARYMENQRQARGYYEARLIARYPWMKRP